MPIEIHEHSVLKAWTYLSYLLILEMTDGLYVCLLFSTWIVKQTNCKDVCLYITISEQTNTYTPLILYKQ